MVPQFHADKKFSIWFIMWFFSPDPVVSIKIQSDFLFATLK